MILNYFYLTIFFTGTFVTLFFIINKYILELELKNKLLQSSILKSKISNKSNQNLFSNDFLFLKRKLLKLTPNKVKSNLELTLKLSGSKWDISDIVFLKFLLLIILIFIALLLTKAFNVMPLKTLLVTVYALIGFFIPDILLKRKVTLRKKSIKQALPSFIDFLTVSVEAGLGLDLAIYRIIKRIQGPLSEEMAYAMTEIQYGKTKQDAFRSLQARVNIPEFTSFLNSLINGERLGISVGTTLKIQGQQIRENRKQKIQEKAYKISVKLVFPLVLFILPGLFIVLLGPALIQASKIFFK